MNNRKNTMYGCRPVLTHRFAATGLAACLVLASAGPDTVVNFLIPPVAAEAAPIDGGQLYNTYCAVCHKAGLNAAPKYGSKPLWAKRIAQGRDTVYSHAINGLRGMPARGGYAQLSDEEIKAATDYMVKAAGGWGDE